MDIDTGKVNKFTKEFPVIFLDELEKMDVEQDRVDLPGCPRCGGTEFIETVYITDGHGDDIACITKCSKCGLWGDKSTRKWYVVNEFE